MPVVRHVIPGPRFALVPLVFLLAAFGLALPAQPPEPVKKPADPKVDPKIAPAPKELPGLKLPDGTVLWLGSGGDERVSLTPQEWQKLQDQVENLKKQLAARKAVSPSSCAVRGRIEQRGDQSVAAIKLTLAFRTTQPQTVVALGGRKGFLVAAALDGDKLPVLETAEDGLAAVVGTAGDHQLTLDLEAPVTSRGGRPELGFEVGLPRAAITTVLFDPPSPELSRVNLTTRTPDPSQPARPPEARRVNALDVKQLAARPGRESGFPLGPVESLELSWDPPAAAKQPADSVQSADLDIAVVLTEGVVETTARYKLHGPARDWKFVAPATANLSVDRAAGTGDTGTALAPTLTRPAGGNKLEWKVEFPVGAAPGDWVVTAVTRQQRGKSEEAKHKGPFPIGPFSVLDVFRQTGSVRVTAGPNSRFVFKHGPDLRRIEPPGPAEDDVSTAFFRLTTGPTAALAITAPLLTVEASRIAGRVVVKPAYKLTLTEAGWRIRAELKVTPLNAEIDSLAVDVPARWSGLEAAPADLVEGIQPGTAAEGFWFQIAEYSGGEVRQPVVVRLASVQKQPFELVLHAIVPFAPGSGEIGIPLPRFPASIERDASISATVPEGWELRGEARSWEGGRSVHWPLASVPGPLGKSTRAVTAITGRSESGFVRAVLGWQPYHPELAVDLRADLTLFDRQLVVQQVVRMRAPEGLPRPIRFHVPATAAAVKVQQAQYPLDQVAPGEWNLMPPVDAKEIALTWTFAVPLGARHSMESGGGTIPVSLIRPAAATRSETVLRIWSNTVSGSSFTTTSPGWRELPIEPIADRDALPALVLASTGPEAALELAVQEARESSAVTSWVDRGLIQAWSADDGATHYRARFLLRRWLTSAVEIRLPGSFAGPAPEFLRDGQRIEPIPLPDADGARAFRIPLPEPRVGRSTLIEVRYRSPVSRGSDSTYLAPSVMSAAFLGPVRWQVALPPETIALLIGGAIPELRWRPRSGLLAPGAAKTAEELEQWLRAGDDRTGEQDAFGPAGDSLTARQARPESITVHRFSRVGFVVACSVAVLVLFLVMARLPKPGLGVAIALTVICAGAGAISIPHVLAQFVGACQPGLIAIAVVILVQLGARWSHHRRITHLPGFSRSLPEPSVSATPAPAQPSSRNRPVLAGSTGAAPVGPVSG